MQCYFHWGNSNLFSIITVWQFSNLQPTSLLKQSHQKHRVHIASWENFLFINWNIVGRWLKGRIPTSILFQCFPLKVKTFSHVSAEVFLGRKIVAWQQRKSFECDNLRFYCIICQIRSWFSTSFLFIERNFQSCREKRKKALLFPWSLMRL